MKKLLMAVFALCVVLGLAACGDKEADYKLGMGVEVSTSSSTNATAEKAGNAQVDATVAAVVVDKDGKIVACRLDAVQNKIAVSATGELTATFGDTKRCLKEEYGMGGKPYSPDNDGDGRVLEWYEQSLAFSKHVVGMTAAEVAAMTTKTANDHEISTDETLLAAGCTIQITGIKAVVAKSANNAR